MTINNTFTYRLLEDIQYKHNKNIHHEIPNLLFYGKYVQDINNVVRTICNILSNVERTNTVQKNHNILLLDCIFNSSIINIRNNIQHFIKTRFSRKQGRKIIILSRLDELSDEAQCALRVLMEENNTNLFIGIALNINNIVMPIVSRMMSVFIDADSDNNEKIRTKTTITKYYNYSHLFYKMKYNCETHWLYGCSERNMEIILLRFNEIKKELFKIEDIDTLLELFRELKHYLGSLSVVTRKEPPLMGNAETLINTLLMRHIEFIGS